MLEHNALFTNESSEVMLPYKDCKLYHITIMCEMDEMLKHMRHGKVLIMPYRLTNDIRENQHEKTKMRMISNPL